MPDPQEIALRLTGTETIEGHHPVVVIGPNGSGKTRFGVKLATDNGGEMIGAVRNISLPPNLPMQALNVANQNLSNILQRRQASYWEMSDEIGLLYSKLMAEDSAAALRFREAFRKDATSAEPKETTLERIRGLWSSQFPGRSINFGDYSPKVSSELSGADSDYSADRMSDGERVALYLAGRTLDAKPGVLVIDEPEVHFHSRLAIDFWDQLQALRPDLRFVYITHDLSFAMSRRGAQFVIVRQHLVPEVVPIDENLPQEIARAILGAASFSIYARRIVFCEGTDGASDKRLYSAWFRDRDTAVVPVGSGSDVVMCVTAFGNNQLVAGASAIGIIDRDYWPDEYINGLHESVFALPVHEIENLYCLRGVYLGVAEHLGADNPGPEARYEEFLSRARQQFEGKLLNKQVLERFKRRCRRIFDSSLGQGKVSVDIGEVKNECLQGMDPAMWEKSPATVFEEEEREVKAALNGGDEEFHRLLPGKVFISLAAATLGVRPERYRSLVEKALRADYPSLEPLGKSIEVALREFLPSRAMEEPTNHDGGAE